MSPRITMRRSRAAYQRSRRVITAEVFAAMSDEEQRDWIAQDRIAEMHELSAWNLNGGALRGRYERV